MAHDLNQVLAWWILIPRQADVVCYRYVAGVGLKQSLATRTLPVGWALSHGWEQFVVEVHYKVHRVLLVFSICQNKRTGHLSGQ